MNLPNWLLFWIWQALIGEIYPAIRAIAIGFDSNRHLHIRLYMYREPIEDDYENLNCIITNIEAHTSSNDDFSDITDDIIYSTEPLSELDCLDGFVYARKETTMLFNTK